MSGRETGRRPSGWRTVNATIGGTVAGVSGLIFARAIFGGGVALAGLVIGVIALLGGASLAWGLSSPRHRHRTSDRPEPGLRLRKRVHPLAWFAPVVGSAVTMAAWAGIAHSSGSGWVQAVGALMAAVLVTGIVAPVFPARRAVLTCTACPSDTDAGREVALTMAANGPIRIRPRHPIGPTSRAVGPSRGSRTVEVSITPDRRGVLEAVVVELASCAPFGVLWWAREIEVALPRPLHVAPRFGEPGPIGTVADNPSGQARLRVPSGAGDPRGIRPYLSGDTRRSVHWPATSHVGSLMVRERERQTDDPMVVDLVLPPDPQRAEEEAERVMAGVTHHLGRGQSVVLATLEADGRIVRPVRDRIDLGRRLARAVASPTRLVPSATSPGQTSDRPHPRGG